MTLRFHPLADLFPLIEGKEFDELVNSIKENGQHDPVVMFDNMILDGRNRYRACLVAKVEPKFEAFTGKDPIAFVMDHNIHRRHLNESQRALIAAKLATMKLGENQHRREGVEISTPSVPAARAAEMLNVDRHTVFAAKKVLSEGTAEEIRAVEKGDAAVSTIARDIRAKRPAGERKARRDVRPSQVGKNPQRIETQRINGQVWCHLRDGLTALTNLPIPSDVVAIVRAQDRTGLVDSRIRAALEWLQEFSDAWCNRDKAEVAAEGEEPGDRNPDATAGDRAA